MTTYSYSPQTAEDWQTYYDLRWQVLRDPWQQPRGSEKDEFENQAFHVLMKDNNEQAIAVGRLHLTGQHRAQIRYMAVSTLAQGQGLGRQIVELLEQQAIALGVSEITLHSRETAIEFYQSLGYVLGEQTHTLFDEVKHFLMDKVLSENGTNEHPVAQRLQQTWHETIPLSKAMNIEVAKFDEEELVTTCDPLFSKNLHNTMFAGSVYTLATLTGWGWVYCEMEKHKIQGDIVLAKADIKYLKPVEGVAYARTNVNEVKGDINDFKSLEKAKFNIQVELCCGDSVCAVFNGVYVAKKKISND